MKRSSEAPPYSTAATVISRTPAVEVDAPDMGRTLLLHNLVTDKIGTILDLVNVKIQVVRRSRRGRAPRGLGRRAPGPDRAAAYPAGPANQRARWGNRWRSVSGFSTRRAWPKRPATSPTTATASVGAAAPCPASRYQRRPRCSS